MNFNWLHLPVTACEVDPTAENRTDRFAAGRTLGHAEVVFGSCIWIFPPFPNKLSVMRGRGQKV